MTSFHGYTMPQPGDVFDSVTNALNALPKEALKYWSAKVVAETAVEKLPLLTQLASDDPQEAVKWLKGAPWSKRDKAADMGTAVHEVVELDATGRTDEADAVIATLDPTGQAKARQARDFFQKVDIRVTHAEFVVYNVEYAYAGTGDFIGIPGPNFKYEVPGVEGESPTLIVDLKTGNDVYPEAALQVAAYRYATHMVDLSSTGLSRSDLRRHIARGRTYVWPPPEVKVDPMPNIDGALVLHVTEKSWALLPIDTSKDAFDQFIAARRVARFLPLDRLMVGTAIARGRA